MALIQCYECEVVTLLWVPVDGVAQTEAQRRLAESYETRARQIEALINPVADESEVKSYMLSCMGMESS